jgi:uncharacterized protein
MRKKLLSKTYLWEATSYNIKFIVAEELDYYASIKKILKRNKPFIISNGDCLIDNNYSMIEILPKNENYSMRVYFNEKNEILQYYFDISAGNGIDQDALVPYYDDLYLDVTYSNGEIKLLDYNELEEALHDGIIDEEKFNLANKVANNLIKELKNGTNKYFNLNLIDFLM